MIKFQHQVARALPVFVLACSLLSAPARSQFMQQVKLVATGEIGNAGLGSSASVSADGNTSIIGGFYDNNEAGAAWVFTRSGGVWSQQAKLIGTSALRNAVQGWSVSISGDGNTAIVGGPNDSEIGAAWVFTRSGSVWSQQTKLVGTDVLGSFAVQGISVSLSSDGNTAIVGGYGDNGEAGAAWVFTRSSGGVWSQQAKLVGAGVVFAALGYSVSLSKDGNTALVGGPYDDFFGGGAAWVFTRSGGLWRQEAKLVGVGAVGNAEQGFSVSLSGDGNTAIVGGNEDNNMGGGDIVGAAWVFARAGGVWSQQAKLVGAGIVGGAYQGFSVSLSGNGNTAVVGGPLDDNEAGAAWVFTRSGGVWSQQGSKLVGTGAIGPFGAEQGWSVSLSSDASTAIVGGPNDDSLTGAAWVFTQPVFAGTPGNANCHGKSVSALAQQYGGLNNAAADMGFASVRALQDAIMAYCEA